MFYNFPGGEFAGFCVAVVILVIAIVLIVVYWQPTGTPNPATTSSGASQQQQHVATLSAGAAAASTFMHTMAPVPSSMNGISQILIPTEIDGNMHVSNRSVTLERPIQAKELAMDQSVIHLNDFSLTTRHLNMINSKIYGSQATSSLLDNKSMLLLPTSLSLAQVSEKLKGTYDWIVCTSMNMDSESKIILGEKDLVVRSPSLPVIYGSPNQHVFYIVD